MKRQIGIQIREYVLDSDIKATMEFLGISIGQIFIYPSLSKKSFNDSFFNDCLMYVHGSYRINLAQKSGFHPVIKKELSCMNNFGFNQYVLHPGSWKSSEKKIEALETVSKMITFFSKLYPAIHFIIENTPNQKNLLGADIHDLHFILNNVAKTVPLSFCIDTSHAFAAGYALNTHSGLDHFAQLCTDLLGGCISLIHLNDTNSECGLGQDQHEFPGHGLLGVSFLKQFFSYKVFQSIPIIIEPPAFSIIELKKFLVTLCNMLN